MNVFLFAGLAVVLLGLVVLVQGVQGQQARMRSLGTALVAVGILGAFLATSIVIVPAGHAGVVFNVFGGVQQDELGEGVHVVIPVVQQVTLYDTRQQELTLATVQGDQISARSSEGLEIIVDVTVLYQIDGNEAARLHQDIGTAFEEIRVRPEVRSQIRDGISEFDAANLISSERDDLQRMIEDNLANALERDNVLVLSVLLRDVRIPESITQAIEEKQAAEQQVAVEENRRLQSEIAAQRRVIEATGERDAAVAKAEGEAEALRLRGDALRQNPEIIQLEVAQRLAPTLQTILLPSDSNFLLDLRSLTDPGRVDSSRTDPARGEVR
ncbi:MAG: prohibitin family protein [Trueperaceae bacterium]